MAQIPMRFLGLVEKQVHSTLYIHSENEMLFHVFFSCFIPNAPRVLVAVKLNLVSSHQSTQLQFQVAAELSKHHKLMLVRPEKTFSREYGIKLL